MTITSNFVSLSNTNFWAKLCRYLLGSETRLFSFNTRQSDSLKYIFLKVQILSCTHPFSAHQHLIFDDDCVISGHCVLRLLRLEREEAPLWRVELRSSGVWSIPGQRDWCVSYMIPCPGFINISSEWITLQTIILQHYIHSPNITLLQPLLSPVIISWYNNNH